MDDMKIKSEFLRWIISSIIRRKVKEKYGGDFIVEIIDPIEYYFDDGTGLADIHLGVNIHVRKETISEMLKDWL